jgi:hypothetical protein
MTPSSMRLIELRLCLWWGRFLDQGMRRDTALGHLFVIPLCDASLRVWISMASRDWRLSSHEGQWRLMTAVSHAGGIMTPRYYYGLPGTNAGEHSYGGSSGSLSYFTRVHKRCRKPSGSTTLTWFNQLMWRGGNEGWFVTPRDDHFMRFSLVATAWLASVALPLVICDNPLPTNVHFRSWRLVRLLFSTRTNHLRQGARHRAEGSAALGWKLASVVNDPLGEPGSTPLYFCLPPVWSAAGGILLNPHYSWDHY